MTAEALELGLTARVSFEVEWALGTEEDGHFGPACTGPSYGMTRLIELSDYGREVVGALERQGIDGRAVPPGVRRGPARGLGRHQRSGRRGRRQRAGPPDHPRGVGAIRLPGLVRPVGHRRFGRQRRPCAPQPLAGRAERVGGRARAVRPDRRRRGVRGRDPGRACPRSPRSARPAWPATCGWCRRTGRASSSAGAGRTGRRHSAWSPAHPASRPAARTLRVKCFDLAANPYLVVGSLIAAGLAGLRTGAALPPETIGDPVGGRPRSWLDPRYPPAAAVAGRVDRPPRATARCSGRRWAIRCSRRSSRCAGARSSSSPTSARTRSSRGPAGDGDGRADGRDGPGCDRRRAAAAAARRNSPTPSARSRGRCWPTIRSAAWSRLPGCPRPPG